MPEHAFVTAPPPPAASRGANGVERRTGDHAGVAMIRPWLDPANDERGHDPRSRYVEHFWLGVLGPSATWLVRRLNDVLAGAPERDGVRVDLAAMAQQMGMTYVPGRSSPFARAIQRCVMFGVAHHTGDGLAIRRRLPPVAERHLRRLPPGVAVEHDRWTSSIVSLDALTRAHRLGLAMVGAGDCIDQVEGQLVAIGVDPATAEHVADNLTRLDEAVSADDRAATDAASVKPGTISCSEA